jgi:hypothetical protein
MKHALTAVLVVIAAMVATACDNDSTSPTSSSTGGRLVVRLTDSPYAGGRAILVTFSRVRATRVGGGTVDVPFANGASSITCDLKKLNTSDGEIASAAVPAGQYSGVRLTVQSANLYLDNPSIDAACAASIRPPSGRVAAITLASPDIVASRSFETATNKDLVMRLALNSEQSIHLNSDGSYTFQPVVTIATVN